MGLIGRLLSFNRRFRNNANINDIKCNVGGGENITTEMMQPAGDDSQPLDGDYLAVMQITRSGGGLAVGFIDPNNAGVAEPGEKRIYARDNSGAPVVELWLKNNGDAVLSNENGVFELADDGAISGANDNGSYTLLAGGDFVVNGVTIDTSGNIDGPGNIEITGNIDAGGNIGADGDIDAGGDMSATNIDITTEATINGITFTTHTHSDGTYAAGFVSVSGDSGAPN